jgi:lipopolysaccharide transport system permease protein
VSRPSQSALVERESSPQAPERVVDDLVEAPQKRTERVTIIRPAPRWPRLDLRELWHYRELFVRFIWRDVKVRYKQTFIGVGWAILQPLLTMVIFTLVFGKFAKFPSEGQQYPVFVYAGLLPWAYFSSALTQSSTSLNSNVPLVTKVYFPRVLLPFSAATVPLVDFLCAGSVMGGLMVYYHDKSHLGAHWYLAPGFMLLVVITALGTGLFLSALNARYRDVPYAIPFIVQTWMYVSPVIYPTRALPVHWQWILSVNPITGAISGFRWALLGTHVPPTGPTLVSAASGLLIFAIGLWFFRRSEPKFADTI